ncbi:hypothetical protein SAPIO_CDS9220 [Scedosporium apiospermum]|uniref:Cytochrome P450 n=1 Tax=Pseudallescheria apiosperma TaxID=563466 RepID=A0A084FYK8_PSEDA|nr:uncharacterized protein SAPIO_CDS9220 [Scedosporium apiospermum]KEZ40170.1 hypothetical protein SAPIO_CDS9220 [Scedosporium apiospermum]
MLDHLSTHLNVPLSIVLIGLIFVLKRLYFHPLSKFPGPTLPSLSSFYQFYIFWTRREGDWYSELHEKYDHAAAKRRFGHAYSLPRVRTLESAFDDQIAKFISNLSVAANETPVVNVGLWIMYFSFDIITAVALGTPVGFMDAKGDVRDLIANMEETAGFQQRLSLYPPIGAFARNNPLGRRLFVSTVDDQRGLGKFMAEIRTVVEQRQSGSGKPQYANSLLDQWLASAGTDGQGIPRQEIEDELLMGMMAGPDSIALMTTNLIFLIANDPSVFSRAQAEIDNAYTQGRLSGPVPTYDECRNLPFVTACVNEGLRYIASTFPRRRSSTRPLLLDGKYVPAGTSISSSAASIGRHPAIYGDQADQFLPDRWLDASPEQLQEWARLDVHWGVGVRKCLGKHVGLMALYKTIIMLIRAFDLRLEASTSINRWSYPSSEKLLITQRIN